MLNVHCALVARVHENCERRRPVDGFAIGGSFSERTMALSIPYPGVNSPYRGNITIDQNDLNAWVERVHRAGIQVKLPRQRRHLHLRLRFGEVYQRR